MEKIEQIREIQKELYELQQQVVANYHKIQELQKRLQQLDPGFAPATKAATSAATPVKRTLENFIGLRLIHLAGIVVLVIGLSIGVKYAIDRELISEYARIGLAYAAGIVLFVLSLRLKKHYNLFSAILFSGAMASLYFTTYAAYVYYNMVPSMLAFLLMVIFTIYTVMQAIAYNRQEIALLGLAGAYGIPFLISQNSDRADLFFLYILIINTGIFYLYYTVRWKNVGRITLLLTWSLFLGWSAMRFTSSYLDTALIFGSLFFLLFSMMLLVKSLLRKEVLSNEDIYMQAINNGALYLSALSIASVNHNDNTIAAVTGIFSLFTGLQAWLYHRYFEEGSAYKLHLIGSFLLAILYVLFEWDGILVTFIWMLMAVIVFIWGAWQKMVVLRLSAIALMGITLLKLLLWDSSTFTPIQKVISFISLGVILLLVSFFYQKFRQTLFADKDQ